MELCKNEKSLNISRAENFLKKFDLLKVDYQKYS